MAYLRSLLRTPTITRASTFTARGHPVPTISTRTYHNTPSLRLPYKDDQDRTSVKPKAVEGGASFADEAAADTDAAFDPSKTRPEEQRDAAAREKGKGDESDPLDKSGANPENSESVGEGGGPEMRETIKGQKEKPSGQGNPQKKGKPFGGS